MGAVDAEAELVPDVDEEPEPEAEVAGCAPGAELTRSSLSLVCAFFRAFDQESRSLPHINITSPSGVLFPIDKGQALTVHLQNSSMERDSGCESHGARHTPILDLACEPSHRLRFNLGLGIGKALTRVDCVNFRWIGACSLSSRTSSVVMSVGGLPDQCTCESALIFDGFVRE